MSISPASSNGIIFGSNAEKKIYEMAQQSGYFNTSLKNLYYSLRLSQTGNKKLSGEIDFLYIDDKFIIFLEVKGGEIKYDSLNNQWWVMGGTKQQDPFKQVCGSLFQVRDILLPELFNTKAISNRLIFGYGLLFPECIKPNITSSTIEYSMDTIFDFTDFNRKNGLVLYIENLKKYWLNSEKYQNGIYGISSKELSTITSYFRRDLHFRLPSTEIIKNQSDEISRLTSAQMYALDNFKLNIGKGGIVSGGPGTGKTLLAIELLKRKIEEQNKVLFLCFNKNLADVLNERLLNSSNNESFKITHIHGLYEEINPNELRNTENYMHDFWNYLLPLKIKDTLKSLEFDKYDFVIIDEGQDLLNEYHFDVINELLKDGFESGNWAMFLDHDFQNIYNPGAIEYFDFFKSIYPCYITKLFLNCRNTKSIVRLAAKQTGFAEMPCFRELDSWRSAIKKFTVSDQDLMNSLNQTIANKINDDKIDPGKIAILCFTNEQKQQVLNANSKISNYSVQKKNCVTISTIHSYKGLENEFILIIGPELFDYNNAVQMSLLYIAYTRATVQALFFTKISNQSAIELMLTK
jgi:hypothetical protein